MLDYKGCISTYTDTAIQHIPMDQGSIAQDIAVDVCGQINRDAQYGIQVAVFGLLAALLGTLFNVFFVKFGMKIAGNANTERPLRVINTILLVVGLVLTLLGVWILGFWYVRLVLFGVIAIAGAWLVWLLIAYRLFPAVWSKLKQPKVGLGKTMVKDAPDADTVGEFVDNKP